MTFKVDPLRDIPATKAGFTYVQHRLSDLCPDAPDPTKDPLISAAIKVWVEEKVDSLNYEWVVKAQRMIDRGKADEYLEPGPGRFEYLFLKRLSGLDLPRPFHLEFSTPIKSLTFVSDNVVQQLRVKGESLAYKTHTHEWKATNAIQIGHSIVKKGSGKNETKVIIPIEEQNPNADSYFNKALDGEAQCLSVLGIASVERHEFPVAFTKEYWSIDQKTKLITSTIPKCLPKNTSNFDTSEFLLALYRSGQLPLASENDVRLYVMAIASPLLRDVLPGQLGVYWFTGPVGSGKDYLSESIPEIWSVTGNTRVKFDLTLAGEMEQRRVLAAAGSAIYARAKEAGKSRDMINVVIRLAGTDRVPARGLYMAEVENPVKFTIIADSAEDLPDRKEISRRTVMVLTRTIDESVEKGAVLEEIKRHSIDIIHDLKGIIESKPVEFYLHQSHTNSRPLGHAALANLFGAELPTVKGADLSELFEAMLEYTKNPYAIEDGKKQREKARPLKDSKYECQLLSYRLSHFVEIMSGQPGYRDCFNQYRTGRSITLAMHREAEYGRVRAGEAQYLKVDVGGKDWAFRLVRGDKNFIFTSEDDFHSVMGSGSAGEVISFRQLKNEEQSSHSFTECGRNKIVDVGDEFNFSTDDLLKNNKGD